MSINFNTESVLPPCMGNNFPRDVDALIQSSYKQEFNHGDANSYNLIILDDEGTPLKSVTWYKADSLELVDNDVMKGLAAIEWFIYERNNIEYNSHMDNFLNYFNRTEW